MYTIGEFSAITGITKKTLRYYDEINLLNPSNKDKQNNYRSYDEKKIKQAEKIIRFKNFGLSLTDIRCLIKDGESSSLDDMLKLRISCIEKEIDYLKQQQNNIRKYYENKGISTDHNADLIITQSEFKGGNILFLDFIEQDENLHSIINEFYDYASKNNCNLLSNHYFKKSLNDNDQDKSTIFAFIENKDVQLDIKEMKSKKALTMVSDSLENKTTVYKQLINYAKSENINVSECIEEYNMKKGKLGITIYGLID